MVEKSMRLAVSLLLSLASTALFASSTLAADGPSAIANAYCKARLADDEAATLALLTPSLVKTIDEVKTRSDVIAKATPDEKPPFGDGIPYQSFSDLAQGCEAGKAVEKSSHIEVEVNYLFPDTPQANWTDRLKLVAEGDRLLVDDVLFPNVANGEPDQGLRRVLFEAFDR